LTVADALCGKAFGACPPSSRVATQVVRVWPTVAGFAASTAIAASFFGSAAKAFIAWPSSPGVVRPDSRKLAIVVSFHITGNWWSRTLSTAAARS
jgi:hypothetical protein